MPLGPIPFRREPAVTHWHRDRCIDCSGQQKGEHCAPGAGSCTSEAAALRGHVDPPPWRKRSPADALVTHLARARLHHQLTLQLSISKCTHGHPSASIMHRNTLQALSIAGTPSQAFEASLRRQQHSCQGNGPSHITTDSQTNCWCCCAGGLLPLPTSAAACLVLSSCQG